MHAHTSPPTRPSTRVATGRGSRLDLPADGLLPVVTWHDPVVDTYGHATQSDYVEWFWLPVLGPTATWLARRLAAHAAHDPGGCVVDLAELAASLGVTWHNGHDGPFSRALSRCVMFGACAPVVDASVATLAVRLTMPQLPARHLTRLPTSLREMHNDWLREEQLSRTTA